MIASVFLVLFMLTAPRVFRKYGIQMLLEPGISGLIPFFLSKLIWWTSFVLLLFIWIPSLPPFVLWPCVFAGCAFRLFLDRYIVFSQKQKN